VTDDTEAPRDHLYVIGAGDSIVKIGRSMSPPARLRNIQTGNPMKLRILHVVPGAGHLEDDVHQEFSVRHLGGEWFNFGESDPVAEVCKAIEKVQEKIAKAAAREARRAEDRANGTVSADPPTWNWKQLEPRDDACGEFGCSHFVTLAVSGAAAQHFVDAYPAEGGRVPYQPGICLALYRERVPGPQPVVRCRLVAPRP
jgi:hypothetical protein